jgi:hypothetical protein
MQQMIIALFIKLIIGTDVFSRVQAAVDRWAEKEISGAEKRHGVLNEMEIIGLKAAQWAVRLSIELAVGRLKDYGKA